MKKRSHEFARALALAGAFFLASAHPGAAEATLRGSAAPAGASRHDGRTVIGPGGGAGQYYPTVSPHAKDVPLVSALALRTGTRQPSPEYVKTTDSDVWVEKSFILQEEYSRVLVVTDSETPPERIIAAVPCLNGGGTTPREYEVSTVFATLQEAADATQGGDLVAVMPGVYAGFHIGARPGAGDGRYIHFKAMGDPGEVTINSVAPGKDPNWMVLLQPAHHVIVEGFHIAGATGPGLEPIGPRAGIFLDGDFANSSKMAHHIAIIGNFSHSHRTWGLHSTDTHTVLMQDNLFALSCMEHSAYVSDGSDNYVIRRNIFHASRSSGLQINLDPLASLQELLRHPELAGHGPDDGTWSWARGLLDLATEKFGERNFPDGRGVNFIVENNVIWGNGQGGGGSLNLAGLQDSLIQNNLIYGNYTTGIAMWDNANPYDAPLVTPGPLSPEEIIGPESFSFWGCQRNIVRNNTIIMDVGSRPAMLIWHGSWGNVLRNNIFVNASGLSLDVCNSSIYRTDSGHNVLGRTYYRDISDDLKSVATALDEFNESAVDTDFESVLAQLVDARMEPWVIIEGNWWRLNPDRGNFHPRDNAPLLTGKGDIHQLPSTDFTGAPRERADIGAFTAIGVSDR